MERFVALDPTPKKSPRIVSVPEPTDRPPRLIEEDRHADRHAIAINEAAWEPCASRRLAPSPASRVAGARQGDVLPLWTSIPDGSGSCEAVSARGTGEDGRMSERRTGEANAPFLSASERPGTFASPSGFFPKRRTKHLTTDSPGTPPLRCRRRTPAVAEPWRDDRRRMSTARLEHAARTTRRHPGAARSATRTKTSPSALREPANISGDGP